MSVHCVPPDFPAVTLWVQVFHLVSPLPDGCLTLILIIAVLSRITNIALWRCTILIIYGSSAALGMLTESKDCAVSVCSPLNIAMNLTTVAKSRAHPYTAISHPWFQAK